MNLTRKPGPKDSPETVTSTDDGKTSRSRFKLNLRSEIKGSEYRISAGPIQTHSAAPAGAQISVITAVCTIEGLDRPTETVTLKGPLGGLNVVKVLDVNNMPHLHIGQSVVVTFTQATAISLEKVK